MLARLECLRRCDFSFATDHFFLAPTNESQKAYKLVRAPWPWPSVRLIVRSHSPNLTICKLTENFEAQGSVAL